KSTVATLLSGAARMGCRLVLPAQRLVGGIAASGESGAIAGAVASRRRTILMHSHNPIAPMISRRKDVSRGRREARFKTCAGGLATGMILLARPWARPVRLQPKCQTTSPGGMAQNRFSAPRLRRIMVDRKPTCYRDRGAVGRRESAQTSL